MTQPILGSLAWMNQSMRTVNAVNDVRIKQTNMIGLTNNSATHGFLILTDNNGIVLTTKMPTRTVVNKLVRWI